jgi:hypothetical protein
MSTLIIVEEVLREHRTPMVVREIVEVAAERLPTKSKTPDTVVARDLAMDIKRNGDSSKFTRVSPGKYTLRELVPDMQMNHHMEMGNQVDSAGVSSDASISSHH